MTGAARRLAKLERAAALAPLSSLSDAELRNRITDCGAMVGLSQIEIEELLGDLTVERIGRLRAALETA